MLTIAEIALLSVNVTREMTSPGQGVVIIDCILTGSEESEEITSVPLHWRAGDWSKPPIDIALDAETGRFQSLQLVLQDETIQHQTLSTTELIVPISKTGVPIFERILWSDDDHYVDERFQPMLGWGEQNSLLVVFAPPLVQIAQVCLIGDSLTFLFNEQKELLGFWLQQITREEKRIIRWAVQS